MTMNDPKPVVLLVDDSADIHRLVRARLRHEHLELVCLSSGAEALAHVNSGSPVATILLDMDMPGMDGFSVLRAVKNNPATLNIPVIVISGLAETDDKVMAFDLGAADYVTKPFDFNELRARLRAALRIDRLVRMLAERAELDGLTGLGNRAAFDRRLEAEVCEHARYGRPLALLLFDVDHFKKINDSFGHPAGDSVLQEFAKLIQREIRASDIACRYGGEELAVVLPQTKPEEAAAVGERIRLALQAVRWPRHPEHSVTTSCGVVGATAATSHPPAQWLDAADKALYQAKRSGRNRVVVGEFAEPAARLAKAG